MMCVSSVNLLCTHIGLCMFLHTSVFLCMCVRAFMRIHKLFDMPYVLLIHGSIISERMVECVRLRLNASADTVERCGDACLDDAM